MEIESIQEEVWKRNHRVAIMEEWNPGFGILVVDCLWNPACGVLVVQSWLWHPGCGIMAVESWLWNAARDLILVPVIPLCWVGGSEERGSTVWSMQHQECVRQ